MGKFGWSYPPGCTQAMVDEAVGANDDDQESMIHDLLMEKAPAYQHLSEVAQQEIINVVLDIQNTTYTDAYSRGQQDNELANITAEGKHAD